MALGDFKLENLPRKIQLGIVIALAVALAAVGYTYYLKSQVDERGRLKTEIAALEQAVAQAVEVEGRLQKFKRDLRQLDARLDELRRILPNQKETPEVLRAVQSMASESRLKIVKFVPQPIAVHSFYSDWPIAMEVEGSYNALGIFFEKIGKFRRIVNIDNISVKSIEGSTNSARTLSSTCTATTFVYREETAAAAPDK